jgi:hypothetical protein
VTNREWPSPAARRDAAFLAAAVVMSLVWYVGRLGFYSDDWAFLGRYVTASDQSVGGLFRASNSAQHAMRPVQVWLCAALYRAFGLEPLGYHVFNAVLLAANPVLLYLVIRELRAARPIALSVALIYALLPSYSTDRYWYVAFAITLSMTACLASLYACLRATAAPDRARRIAWTTIAVGAFAISALAYEVTLPIFLLGPFVVAARMWQDGAPRRTILVALLALIVVGGALVASVAGFKLRTTIRLGAEHGVPGQVVDIVRRAIDPHVRDGDYGLNAFLAARVHLGDYGVKLPATAATIARTAPRAIVVLTVAFVLMTFAYLAAVSRTVPWPSLLEWAMLVPAGAILFGLGFAIFLTNYNVQITPTGIANRSAIAAALGSATGIAGCIGWVVTWLPRRAAPIAFAAIVAATAGCGFLIVNAVSEHWVRAAQIEDAVLDGIRGRFPVLPPHSTLILDGVCPYVGPAIVFESNWDLAGALQVVFRDETLKADVVTPRLAILDEGIMTTIYGQRKMYPYDRTLFVYHAGTGAATVLSNVQAGRAYFAASRPGGSCRAGHEGVGVPLF